MFLSGIRFTISFICNECLLIDDDQRKWLEEDLTKLPTGTSVICLSHYPILAVCTILDGGNHTDSKYISELFYKHSDKKINCVSGHIH